MSGNAETLCSDELQSSLKLVPVQLSLELRRYCVRLSAPQMWGSASATAVSYRLSVTGSFPAPASCGAFGYDLENRSGRSMLTPSTMATNKMVSSSASGIADAGVGSFNSPYIAMASHHRNLACVDVRRAMLKDETAFVGGMKVRVWRPAPAVNLCNRV